MCTITALLVKKVRKSEFTAKPCKKYAFYFLLFPPKFIALLIPITFLYKNLQSILLLLIYMVFISLIYLLSVKMILDLNP